MQLTTDKTPATNTGLAKVAVQCSAVTLWLIKVWFSASTFVVNIATFAKPETVTGNPTTDRATSKRTALKQPNKTNFSDFTTHPFQRTTLGFAFLFFAPAQKN